MADTLVGFPDLGCRSCVSEESVPEKRERKNVSKLARSYHAATRCAILVYGLLIEGGHAVERRAEGSLLLITLLRTNVLAFLSISLDYSALNQYTKFCIQNTVLISYSQSFVLGLMA